MVKLRNRRLPARGADGLEAEGREAQSGDLHLLGSDFQMVQSKRSFSNT